MGVLLDVPAGGMTFLRGILDTQVDCQSNFEYLRRYYSLTPLNKELLEKAGLWEMGGGVT